jgi:hypothetical protein
MGLFDTIKDLLEDEVPETLFNASKSFLKKTSAPAPTPKAASTPAPAPTLAPVQQSDNDQLYDLQLEKLIDLAIADGELTEKEKQILFKKAEAKGIDLDEFEMVLEARLYEKQKQNTQAPPAVPVPPMPAVAPVQAPAPKSNKAGDVKKCPACGAVIEAFNTNCLYCGHEFRNVEANNSIQRLFEMLNQVEESKEEPTSLRGMFTAAWDEDRVLSKKKTIVQNFPVPNTKEDIIEFLTLALPLAKKPGFFSPDPDREEMYPVWKAKCEQIIMKARFSMKNDPETLAEINAYGKEIGIK